MNHFIAALWTDTRMLYRTGYAAATVFVFVILLILVLQIARIEFQGFADLMTAIILIDQVVAPLMLVGLMVLLERGEGSLVALAVTPMSRTSYLASKTVAVTFICTLEMLLLVIIAYDGPLSVSLLAIGLFGLAVISTLLGVVVVAPFDTVFRFLLPMIVCGMMLSIPAYGVLFNWTPSWLLLHPMMPSLTLLEGAFVPLPSWRIVYGIGGTLVWVTLAAVWAHISYGKIQLRAVGG